LFVRFLGDLTGTIVELDDLGEAVFDVSISTL
jgi:hypothetical protein